MVDCEWLLDREIMLIACQSMSNRYFLSFCYFVCTFRMHYYSKCGLSNMSPVFCLVEMYFRLV